MITETVSRRQRDQSDAMDTRGFGASKWDRDFDSEQSSHELETPSSANVPAVNFGGNRIPSTSLLLCINQLTVMTQNGIDLSEAIETTAKNAKNQNLANKLYLVFGLDTTSSTTRRSLRPRRMAAWR